MRLRSRFEICLRMSRVAQTNTMRWHAVTFLAAWLWMHVSSELAKNSTSTYRMASSSNARVYDTPEPPMTEEKVSIPSDDAGALRRTGQ